MRLVETYLSNIAGKCHYSIESVAEKIALFSIASS